MRNATNIFSYGFGITIYYKNNERNVRIGLGTAEPQYQMLNYLSEYNSINAVDEVLEEFNKVINGEKDFWGWGTDFCLILTKKDVSIIDHHIDPQTGEWALDPIYKTEIPTAWLLQMMKDWKIFLENNPKEKYR